MSAFINNHPALSLLALAMTFSGIFIAPVYAGALPPGYAQLAAFGPSLAAILLVWITGGRSAVRRLMGRLQVWDVGVQWWLFVLLFPALLAVASLTLYNVFGGPAIDYADLAPIQSIIPMIILLTVAAGLGEEFGWRGFALPRLQVRDNALYASCIVGTIWGIWHTPLFLIDGTMQAAWATDVGLAPAVVCYTAYLIANAIQMTWVFNNTHGSVLLAAVMHGAQNAWVGGYIDVYRGEIGGVIALTAMTWAVAGLLILVTGPEHLSRSSPKQQTVS